MNWQSFDPSIDDTMSCLGVCMATLASPEVGLITVDTDKVGLIVDKDEECDKDSGHHSGEEMDCVINNESQVLGHTSRFDQIIFLCRHQCLRRTLEETRSPRRSSHR